MKTALRICIFLSCSSIASALIAQESDGFYLDHTPFQFTDGVYTNIEMVKKNRPIPPAWIETDLSVNDRDFYKKITSADEIVFYDDNGVSTVLLTSHIWGYSYKGDLYINVGGAFHKIDLVGRISHFIASKTTYDSDFYVAPPGYWIMPPVVTLKHREYLVDIVDNITWEFDTDGLERVLKNDTPLYNEFRTLKKRDKEYQKYIFLNRYNKNFPFDFPRN